MKREVIVVLGIILLISAGAFAQAVANGEVSSEVSTYVKSFVAKGGIEDAQITNITQVDQSELPNGVDLKKIDENKVGIYQVNYEKNNSPQKVFVIAYASNQLPKPQTFKNIQYLSFGYFGLINSSSYLNNANGVQTGADNGYVMIRAGSITGISTSLGINSGEGNLLIKVYKNGEDTGFENVISSSDKKKFDYDTQSENIVNYVPGDIISVYVEDNSGLEWSNAITLVESTS
jgi:hypothetical protein